MNQIVSLLPTHIMVNFDVPLNFENIYLIASDLIGSYLQNPPSRSLQRFCFYCKKCIFQAGISSIAAPSRFMSVMLTTQKQEIKLFTENNNYILLSTFKFYVFNCFYCAVRNMFTIS